MRTLVRRSGIALISGVLAAVALAGCGSSSSTTAQDDSSSQTSPSQSPSQSPAGTGQSSAPSGPRCGQVWQAGSQLPMTYRGCTATAGWVKAQVYQCEDGHHLVTYAHLYYAAPGRSISRAATTLAKDHGFRHVMAACGA